MRWMYIAIAIAVSSCSNKDKPADKPAGSGDTATPAPAKPAEPVATPAKFGCAKAIPQAIADKYFPK
jgi:hypothetical protein